MSASGRLFRGEIVEAGFGPVADDSKGSAAELADLNIPKDRLAVEHHSRSGALAKQLHIEATPQLTGANALPIL